MSLLAGIDRAPSPPTFEQLRRGIERLGAELVPGMYLLSGGYWAVVAEGDITTDNLGRMSVPVWTPADLLRDVADRLEPRRVLVGWAGTVRTRTPEENRRLRELLEAENDFRLHLQIADGRPSLCGSAAPRWLRTTVYGFADCAECLAVADRLMAEAEAAEAAELAEAGDPVEAPDAC